MRERRFKKADLLLTAGSLRGAMNRLYYAAFYAARALLAMRQVDSARHSGVISLFQQHFVKTALVSPNIFRAFPEALEKRLKSDYGDFGVATIEEVETLLKAVRAFVDECERVSVQESESSSPDPHSL